ncbi:hypothetical protein C8R44DRAFT_750580 [Mycena epipterygia]|nr:hypothetical protein C8R44DRAFT_750580 [Mycena epipterygia]
MGSTTAAGSMTRTTDDRAGRKRSGVDGGGRGEARWRRGRRRGAQRGQGLIRRPRGMGSVMAAGSGRRRRGSSMWTAAVGSAMERAAEQSGKGSGLARAGIAVGGRGKMGAGWVRGDRRGRASRRERMPWAAVVGRVRREWVRRWRRHGVGCSGVRSASEWARATAHGDWRSDGGRGAGIGVCSGVHDGLGWAPGWGGVGWVYAMIGGVTSLEIGGGGGGRRGGVAWARGNQQRRGRAAALFGVPWVPSGTSRRIRIEEDFKNLNLEKVKHVGKLLGKASASTGEVKDPF